MTIHIENKRRDGKFAVRYCFSNGVQIKKIMEPAKLETEIQKLNAPFYTPGQQLYPGLSFTRTYTS